MNFQTLLVAEIPQGMSITLNRVELRNALNDLTIAELHQALDEAEKIHLVKNVPLMNMHV